MVEAVISHPQVDRRNGHSINGKTSLHSFSMPSKPVELQLIQYIGYIPHKGDHNYLKDAEKIAGWIHGSKDIMLDKTPQQITHMFDRGDSVLVLDVTSGSHFGQVVGHAGKTETYANGSVEYGAVVIDPAKRGNGAGSETMRQMRRHIDANVPVDSDVIALANEGSLGPFLKNGWKRVENPLELDPGVWALCTECPRNPQDDASKPQIVALEDLKDSKPAQNAINCCDVPVQLERNKPVFLKPLNNGNGRTG